MESGLLSDWSTTPFQPTFGERGYDPVALLANSSDSYGLLQLLFQNRGSLSMKLSPDIAKTLSVGVNLVATMLLVLTAEAVAQQPPYDVFPPADPPYYRVRYEASKEPGDLIVPGQLHDLGSPGRQAAARRDRASARLRRRLVQVGADGRLRPALAGAGEEARLRLAGSVLRAAGKGRLPDVVRSAQRVRRRVSEMPGRPRREIGPSRIGEGALGAVGAQRRRCIGPAAWCCCIRSASPPHGCVPACRC